LLSTKSPLAHGNALPGGSTAMRWFLGALIVYASIGLALSLAVHVASFFFEPPGGNALFIALHVGIFPLWLPIVFVANALAGKSFFSPASLADWRVILQGAPSWMRVMAYGFFVYALANFAVFFIFTAILRRGASKYSGAPPAFLWHGFSGHWMAFYSAGLAIATVAYLRGPGNLARKCPNGHRVSPADRYCATCGRAISPE
jgi:hypothetical protein